MSHPSQTQLRRSPLDALHRASQARMTAFAGWDMPLEYSGIASEHIAVRTRAGLFDVSHMGEIEIAGREALAAVQRVSCNDASVLRVGQAHYSALLTPDGTFVDDILVYRLAAAHFLLVVNAANTARDYAWIAEHVKAVGDAAIVDSSSRYALIAIQGPASADVLQPLTGIDVHDLRYYAFAHGEVASARAMVSRTGYTGEDGFEIFVAPNVATRVWQALLESGRSADVIPCGLGARDTLRLEAAMRLYGQDIDESTTVLEADLGWIVGWSKIGFIGHDALARQRDDGPARKLIGFELLDRGIARHGYAVLAGRTRHVGVVTSGTQTPYLKRSIGLAYVPVELAAPGTEIGIDIRGRESRARVVPLPFYRRARAPHDARTHSK
jgi:aminomethyltransferase